MRILDRYIVREVTRHALLGLAIFTFVFFVPQLVRLMEIFVRHTGSVTNVLLLFLCAFPGVLTFTIPMGVLIGVLIGLGRMSADSELIALSAVGIGRRRVLVPIVVLALTGLLLTGAMTLWLTPGAVATLYRIEASLLASQASFQIQPRVFDERFPKLVLYVNDVAAGGTRWNGVFLAEVGADSGSRVTLAENAIVIADRPHGKLDFHLRGGATHECSPQDPDRYSVTAFGQSDWPIEFSGLQAPVTRQPGVQERSLRELFSGGGPNWREARVELHRRFAFPAACLVFALLAVPLGTRPRRGGRAAGFLVAVVLIASYYLLFIFGAGMAREGILSPALGIWGADVILALLALVLLPRMEQIGPETDVTRLFKSLRSRLRSITARRAVVSARKGAEGSVTVRPAFLWAASRGAGFPQLLDLYVLRRFLYLLVVLGGLFIFLFEAFTFFELLDDIARNHTPFLVVVNYFRYFSFYLGYQLAPLSALVAVLVTLGVMSKNNEIVACKAGGVSLYRLALPLLLVGAMLAGSMLVMDDTFLPYASQRQDALRNQIKGRPPQTYAHPRHQWIFGENAKIFNYDLFDPASNLFGGLSVFELDPSTFDIRRRIYAARAQWEPVQKLWVLQSGWVRDFAGGQVVRYQIFRVADFPELSETPGYFNRESRQAFQMNWRELHGYIEDLHNAGFDVSTLTVQWHKKLAYPLIAPIIMLLAIPFAFFVGTRGAVGGVALGVAIGMVYWAVSALFEALGGVGQLPPFLAGWSPDVIFGFLGVYFFLKMKT
ncbi:MAG: LPS export ABC transporter permease LptF [Candidatus Acidiferrales bacterium]|jgi:LPS export ABC transporter permease LptF/LPS export ABC transporter permease LptG